VLPSKVVQVISPKGFDGGIGTFVCGTSFIEIGLLPIVTGDALGRHAAKIEKDKAQSKMYINFIKFILHKNGANSLTRKVKSR
jgi:hypothetical protein